jgi:putative oxidoreductase
MNLGLLAIRVVVGLLFLGHGAQKLFGRFGGQGPAGTGALFESLGLRPGRQTALAAGAAEMTGGILFATGLVTPLGSALISAVMLVAIWTVHRSNGLWITDEGFEYNLVLLALAFGVSAIGAGTWSLDHVLGLDVAGAGWALAELTLGGIGATLALAFTRLSPQRPARRAHPARG